MERKRITCPESAHLEEIEYERTPHGLVIASCSRFKPSCAVTCSRDCARRLDRKDVNDNRDRVLVVFTCAPATRPVAIALAEQLARDGLVVELADVDTGGSPPPADYDAVVIGTPQWLGRRTRSIVDYIVRNRDELAAMPTFWFAVGHSRLPNAARMCRAAGWLPPRSFAIVRPSWYVRWFGDPMASRAPSVNALALEIGEEIPDHARPAS